MQRKADGSVRHSQATERRSLAEIERAMERARDLRAATLVCGLRRLFRRDGGRFVPALQRTAALAGLVTLGIAAMPGPAPAQEASTARLERPAPDADQIALAPLGIDAAAIERCDDVPALWRAVRELVLPGRVSEPTQQRILRRVWLADRDIRDAPASGSDTN